LLLTVFALSLSACTGYEGEALTGVKGDGISAITGAGLRGFSANSASFAVGGLASGGSSNSSGGDTATGAGRLSGTYYAEDGSGSITFSGNTVSFNAFGMDWDEYYAMLSFVEITYALRGDTLFITITATIMGETASETESFSFRWDGSNAFYLDGVRFTR
jgi:hypothetical protein